jgi:WD40 repeat protein
MIRALGLALCVLAWVPALARAGEPPAEPVLRIETGMHTAIIKGVTTDAASRYLVTGGDDKTVRVWDLGSGRLLQVLRPPLGADNEGKIFAVAMSPDGALVACGGWTGYEWDGSNSIYVFDRATGRLVRHIAGLASIHHLAWSPDGRQLAAALGARAGIRVFRALDGAQVGADTAYNGQSYGVDFHRSGKLVSTALDGMLRLYRVSESALTLIERQPAPGGTQPFGARFSPDGTRIAVGYADTPRVDVVSGDNLRHLYAADTRGANGDLSRVAWSADGRLLYAGGRYAVGDANRIRAWGEAGRGQFTDVPVARHSIMAVAPLTAGGLVYGAADGLIGALDAGGRKILEQRAATADFRENPDGFRVSRDGAVVQFAFSPFGRSPARFDLSDRHLRLDPLTDPRLVAAVTSAPGVDVRDWKYTPRPTLNGQPLGLEEYEFSHSVTITPDQQSLVLGATWSLRRFDRLGRELWRIPAPGVVWGVNVSGDGQLIVAALGDGTIRWYRASDGKALLVLFPHADRTRWVLWSPSGYYDVSPGAEELIGWHLNRGKDAAADFYPVAQFRATFYRPDMVARVLQTLDESAALRLANEEAGRKTQTVDIAKALPPVIELLGPADGTAVSSPEVRVRFGVRTAADAPVLGLRARVNGQPVSLPDARTIAVEATPGAARELSIPIPPQDSDIMLFAENRHGVSVPAVLRVTWRGPAAPIPGGDFAVKPKLYVLAVGVGQYQNVALTLQYPAKDARDFAQAMLAQKGGLYRDVEAKILTDAGATRDEVVDGLDWLQRQVTARDVGMLFLAGHGVNDPSGIYYYLPANADVGKLKRTGVPFSDIKNTLASLAGKALFFVDTCHSGNVMGGRRAAPTDITAVVNELASAENGVVVFASSTGRQYSLESPEWNNGAFTKALVEGVNGKADLRQTGKITHKMLDFYLSERVKELTGGRQTPVNPSPQGVPDFPIALKN